MSEQNSLPSVFEYGSNIADAQPPKPLPAGTYRGVVKMVETQRSKNSGALQAKVDFIVDPKQYPADFTDGDANGTLLSTYINMEDNPKANYRRRLFCEAIGAPMSKRIDVTQWMGLEAKIEVTHEDYQGLPQARVGKVNAI